MKNFEIEYRLCKDNPYEYILNFYEGLYAHIGRKVMSVLSLVPCSLIIPPFYDQNGKKIHTRISVLLLSPPGTGKSSIGNSFKKITYNPFPFEYITDSKLSSVLAYRKRASLIVTDIARVFSNPILSKQIENVIGEEGCLSRFTQRTNEEVQPIDAVAYFAGTYENLSENLKEGNLFRTVPILVSHSVEEHTDILNTVNNSIGRGKPKDFIDKEEVIIKYYQELLEIQEGKHGEINPIEGYIIPENFRDIVARITIPILNDIFRKTDKEFVREIQYVYKYMVSHAFLNIFNRRIEKGCLIMEEDDLRVALTASKNEIATKGIILQTLNNLSRANVRTEKELKMWVIERHDNKNPVSKEEYKLMEALLKAR